MPTSYTTRTIPTTSYSTRPSIEITDAIGPIVSGFWDDLAIWSETGKFWRDNGNVSGTAWTGRTLI